MDSYRQFIRFSAVGTLGFVVDVAVLYLILHLGFGYFAGRAMSFLCAALVTWYANRHFTFSARLRISPLNEGVRYLAAMSFGGLINYFTYSVFVMQMHDIPFLPLFAVATGSIAGLVINFLSAKFWVFKPMKKPTQ